MRILGVIPARYNSTRFPGKPLANILGKSMIQRVYNQACKAQILDKVIVATDNDEIYTHVNGFAGNVLITNPNHQTGTERCNEVIEKINNDTFDIIINIQGDEPFIKPQQITELCSLFKDSSIQIATLAKEITSTEDIKNPNTTKVIFDKNMIAQSFSRKLSVQKTYYKHIGIYGYRTQILSEITKLEMTKNEMKENLEQLRWLDNGYKIKVGITVHESQAVDKPDDILKIETKMR